MLLKTIDIGHRNMFMDEALSYLEVEISQAIFGGKIRAIKVIHGHGKGALRKALRSWCKDNEGRFQKVVYGEDYDYFNVDAMDMRRDCELPVDFDLGKKNRAVTYIWFW